MYEEDLNNMLWISECIVFVCPSFGSWGATGMAFVGSCQKLPPCLAGPMLAGTKMDVRLVTAGPIRTGGNASVIMYLRKKVIAQM